MVPGAVSAKAAVSARLRKRPLRPHLFNPRKSNVHIFGPPDPTSSPIETSNLPVWTHQRKSDPTALKTPETIAVYTVPRRGSPVAGTHALLILRPANARNHLQVRFALHRAFSSLTS